MNEKLPRLRTGLDIIPSPIPDKPGLIFRDPFRYSEEILVIPPLLAAGLVFFDGMSSELDIQAYLTRLAGQLIPGEVVGSLVNALKSNGYLEDEEFERRRTIRHQEFAGEMVRRPAHAGAGYPDDAGDLGAQLDEYLRKSPVPTEPLNGKVVKGLAAPHVSPWAGWKTYATAYGRLSGEAARHARGKTIILLGTSHYGEPEKFGLTRKTFETPLGSIAPDLDLIDKLIRSGKDSIIVEDYCHAIEHSIEFQCIFLQQILGSDFKIVPILCGPYAKALISGDAPEKDDHVKRFLDSLGELAELHGSSLFWILGIDLSHIGQRYGDEITALADRGEMLEIKRQDHLRLDEVMGGRPEEFFELVKPGGDRLKWCGFSPLYTYLKIRPRSKGELLHYEQWNIDEKSVVSYAAIEFQ